jgi:hypothetical protein
MRYNDSHCREVNMIQSIEKGIPHATPMTVQWNKRKKKYPKIYVDIQMMNKTKKNKIIEIVQICFQFKW